MRSKNFVVDAIESPPGRDEEIGHKSVYFANSLVVDEIQNLDLRKYQHNDDLWYGLFDTTSAIPNDLVGILQLERYMSFWQVRLSQVAQKFKSQGFGSYLYDYAVMNDGLTLLADVSQTGGEFGGSKGLWEKLYRQGRFTVCGYNLDTNETITIENATEIHKIYNQKDDIVWMASPKQLVETINEMLTRINHRNKHRHIEWYGKNIQDISHES